MIPENHIKSIRRAIVTLKCFTPQELELGGTEIARKVGVHKTTAYRILATLAHGGLIEQNAKTGKYMIGPALYAIGNLYLSTTDLLKAAKPVSEIVNELSGETVSLGIRDSGNVILMMREQCKHAFKHERHIGEIMPAYATAMGKALLSDLPDVLIDNLYPDEYLHPLTEKTIKTKKELKIELEQIRKTGISFNREESYKGVEAFASLIRNAKGEGVATLSISVPIFRIDNIIRERLANIVYMGAKLISYRLGHQDPMNNIRDINDIRNWWEQTSLDLAQQGR